jgi:3'-phosphoadenosine 5'-phosphosulfate (PAPS) 3'-phosphatase
MTYHPDLATWHWAERGLGAWREDPDGRHELVLAEPEDPPRIQYAPECAMRIGEESSHGYMKHVRRLLGGKLDVYLRSEIGYWDLVPPMLLLLEAGGAVVDRNGRPYVLDAPDGIARDVVSGHPAAVAAVVSRLRER